jgi:hypothetical protein
MVICLDFPSAKRRACGGGRLISGTQREREGLMGEALLFVYI